MARTAEPQATAGIVSLKITLRGSKPPIWRRVLVPASMTLRELHRVIQCVMPWEDSHLHVFDVQGKQFGDRSMLDDAEDERRMTLAGLTRRGAIKFSYTYDFGDHWEHSIRVEKLPANLEPGRLPRCVAGKRAGPPEDCGGIWGYMGLLGILADPSHPQHEERKAWFREDDFDPEGFEPAIANAELFGVFGKG